MEILQELNPLFEDCFSLTGVSVDDKEFRQAFVYSYYDKEGSPLYVGKTISLVDRMDNHMKQDFWKDAYYIGLIMSDFESMDIVEVIEIRRKHPKFNKDCNKHYEDKYLEVYFPESPLVEISTNYTEEIYEKNRVLDALYKTTQEE